MPKWKLSEREIAVVVMLSEGMQYKHIGRKLGISHRTVESHLATAKRKTGLKTTLQVIAYVLLEGGK